MSTDIPLNINNLNDYCLLNIFKNLPLREKIILSSVSLNLKRIFLLYLRTNREFYLDLNYDIWSLSDIQITFNQIGEITEEFQIKENNKYVPRVQTCFDFVLEYCPNLKVLQLNGLQNSRIITTQIPKKFHNLEKLEIFKGQLRDHEIKELSKLINIKILDLSESHEITGQHLDQFKNLQFLKMNYCTNLKKSKLLQVFNQLSNLIDLELEHSAPICNTLIGIIIDNCKLLENLKMRVTINKNSENWQRLIELKNLKLLGIEENWSYHGTMEEIRPNRNIINNVLLSLAKQLQYLKIHFMQVDHDKGYNTERFNAIFQLKNLTELHLIGYLSCYVIYWRELIEYIDNSKLKILNFTHSNSMLDFGEAHLIEFLENRITSKLDEVNIIYPNTFLHMPFFFKFLEKMSSKQPVFQTKFTLHIKVGEKTKNQILRHSDYLATRELFNLKINLSHSDYTSYSDGRAFIYYGGEIDEDDENNVYDEGEINDELDHGDIQEENVENLPENVILVEEDIIHANQIPPIQQRPRDGISAIINDANEIKLSKYYEKTMRIVLNPDLI